MEISVVSERFVKEENRCRFEFPPNTAPKVPSTSLHVTNRHVLLGMGFTKQVHTLNYLLEIFELLCNRDM